MHAEIFKNRLFFFLKEINEINGEKTQRKEAINDYPAAILE